MDDLPLKDKKVLVFAGRVHHYLRLSPLVNGILERGGLPLWVAADNMINIDPSTEYLIKQNAPHVHLLDYLGKEEMDVVHNMTRYLQGNLARNAPDGFWGYFGPYVLSYSLREIAECLVGFTYMIRKEQPALVVVLHENNFWTKILAAVSYYEGIPVIGFQEGLLRHRDQKTQKKQSLAAEFVNRLYVWSESAQSAYIDAGVVQDKILAVGMSHLDPYYQTLAGPAWGETRKKVITALGLSLDAPIVTFGLPQIARFDGDPVLTLAILAKIMSEIRCQFLVKFHPLEQPGVIQQIKAAVIKNQIRFEEQADTSVLMAISNFFITQHSTVGLEALALGAPVGIIDLQHVGVLESLVDDGVAFDLSSDEQIKNTILGVITGKTGRDQKQLESWLAINAGPRDGFAVQRILDDITQNVLLHS